VIMSLCAVTLSAQSPITFRYFYDDTGQLTKVVDSTGVVIEYLYDPVGNMVEIKRSAVAPGALTIFSFSPQQGGPLTSVTISGHGFSPTPAQNTVRFNGVSATVISATPAMVVVTVPTGATTGPITIMVGTNTAPSPAPFIIRPGPVITSVTPRGAIANSTIANFKVTGINLTGSTFSFSPAFAPPAIGISSVSIDPMGTSATMVLTIGANAAGNFTLVAANAVGMSNAFPSPATAFSVVTDPAADSDADGLPNGLEILVGTDPLNPDTDSDSFSDGVEVASSSDPLDPSSTPLTSRISGYLTSKAFSVSNAGPTPSVPKETATKTFTVLNTGASVKVPIEAGSKPFTVLSIAPTVNVPIEAGSIPFSLCNTFTGPNSCSNYSGLSFVPKVQTTRNLTTGSPQDAPAVVPEPEPEYQRPFSVLSVAPSDEAINVALNSVVALAFSAPLDPASISSANFSLSVDEQALDAEIRYSADFRTVMLSALLPVDVPVRIAVSGQVRDIWGRELLPFQSSFRTVAASRNTASAVVAQRPPPGATDIRPDSTIHLVLSRPVDWNSAHLALRITQDGEPVEGTIRISTGGTDLEFVAYSPLRAGSVVKVSLSASHDASGRLGADYEGLFTTASESSEIPEPLRALPGRAFRVPLNPVIEVEYSRPLDYSTVTAANVAFRQTSTSQVVAANITLRGDHIVRVTPSAPLTPSTEYSVEISAEVRDATGQRASPLRQLLMTGSESMLGLPRLLKVTPSDQAGGIVATSEIRLSFDRPINPLTVNTQTVQLRQDNGTVDFLLSFSGNGSEIIVTPAHVLKDQSRLELSLSGIEDLAANVVPAFSVGFQVRATPQLAQGMAKANDQSARGRITPTARRAIQFLIKRR